MNCLAAGFSHHVLKHIWSWSLLLHYCTNFGRPSPMDHTFAGSAGFQQPSALLAGGSHEAHPVRLSLAILLPNMVSPFGPAHFGPALGAKFILVHGLVKFDPAVAYHSCLSLPATLSQPCTKTLAHICIVNW